VFVHLLQGHNIFMNLSSEQYSEMMNLLKHAILATDLSLHIQYARLSCVSSIIPTRVKSSSH